MKPRLTQIDSIYLPVKNRKQSMDWFKEHFYLEEDDHNRLKIGNLEVFFLETIDNSTTTIKTKDWVSGDNHFEMPAFCFRTEGIKNLYDALNSRGVKTESIQNQGWFLEFDFYDLDNNKFKVWEPMTK